MKELFKQLQAKREELQAWLKEHPIEKMDSAQIKEFNDRHDEINALGEKYDLAQKADAQQKAYEAAGKTDTRVPFDGGDGREKAEVKSIGLQFVESAQFKARSAGMVQPVSLDVDLKTLMTTSANGYPPEVTRNGDVVPLPHRPLVVADLLNVRQTNQNSVKFMQQSVFTNAAAETAEAGAYPESALTWVEATCPVVKIPTFIPVTDEELEDEQGLQALIEQELGYMLLARLDSQILVGDGVGSNMTGLLNGAAVQAKGADPAISAIGKGILKVQSAEYTGATAIVMNPTDYWGIRLTTTADGIYILGNPADVGPLRLFGAPIVQTTAETSGTALVGDFQTGAYLCNRRGVDIQVGYNNDDFVKGKKSIRADIRVALPIRRPLKFAKVTGL